MNFAQNIKYLRNKHDLSQEAMADELGITRSRVTSYEYERAEPNIEALLLYSEYFKLPIDALIKTDLTLSKDGAFLDIGNHRILYPVLVNDENEDVIEVIPRKASAGYLQGYTDTEYFADMPIMNLSFLPSGKYRAFPIEGDSMHPWVQDGDYVVGEFMENARTLKSGDCYIILTAKEGLVYKRVFTDRLKDGYITLHSDNTFYKPYDVHLSEVLELWKFTLRLGIGQYNAEQLNPESIMKMMYNMGVEMKSIKEDMSNIKKNIA